MHKEQWASHVDVELSGKVFAVDVFDVVVAGDASIVDDDVELELARLGVLEVVLGDFYEVLRAVF